MNNEQKSHIASLFRVLVEGYKAKDWLFSHSCETCNAGADAFEKGQLNEENMFGSVCPEAFKALTTISKSDFLIAQLDQALEMVINHKRDQYKPLSEELGLKFI